MDYKFIFCLLFALITSKREFLSLLDKENVGDDPASSCQAAESKDQCLNIENPLIDYQCCYRSLKVDDKSSIGCIDFYKNIDGIQNYYKSEKYQAYNKEIYGYNIYVVGNQTPKQDINIDCKNGQIAYTIGDYEFTEADQNIIKNEKFCYNKYYSKIIKPDFDEGNCEEGLILDSNKNSGFECGTVLYTIQTTDKTLSFKLCELFNLYYYTEMIELPLKSEFKTNLKHMAKTFTNNQGYESYKSFVVEYSNQKGQKIKYDSTTDEFIIDNNNNGYMLTATKYLFLLLLILF